MDKKIKDSWVDFKKSEENFLGRKRVDITSFVNGTPIPERYHEIFLNNLSSVERINHKFKVLFNNKVFNGTMQYKRDGAFIFFSYGKQVAEILQKELRISYNYIIEYKKSEGKNPSSIPEAVEEFIDFYKGSEKDTFILKLIKNSNSTEKEDTELADDKGLEEIDSVDEFDTITSISETVNYIHNYIISKGFHYDKDLITNLYLSLKTKPFVILSGISGTGKSKIVELFAEAIGATLDNGRFIMVPVRPDWSDGTDLLGYKNLQGKFMPGIIMEAAYEAMKHPEHPYFLCLDEMNLARVEYYFSDILSSMETRKDVGGEVVTGVLLKESQFGDDGDAFVKYGDVYIPQNLYIVGTVNMDETTFPFSKKVLDRANTIEFNKVDLRYSFDELTEEDMKSKSYSNEFLKAEFLKLSQCKPYKDIANKIIDKLVDINKILEKYNQHFAFRVRDEIAFYCIYADNYNLLSFEKAMDYSIVQKILPKLGGSGQEVLEILLDIFNYINGTDYKDEFNNENLLKDLDIKAKEGDYKLSSEKIVYMIRRFIRDGFTTFWQ